MTDLVPAPAIYPWEPECPNGWPPEASGGREGPCGLIGCCSLPGPADHDRSKGTADD